VLGEFGQRAGRVVGEISVKGGKRMNRRWFCLGILSVFSLASNPAYALSQKELAVIDQHSEREDVLKALGAPNSRDEHESAREEYWTYDAGVLMIHEGRAQRWVRVNPENGVFDEIPRPPVVEATVSAIDPEGKQVNDIISEILKEVPIDNSPSGSGPAANPAEPKPLEVTE
jgi:hypothetical protein